jgi:hypothetical protein
LSTTDRDREHGQQFPCQTNKGVAGTSRRGRAAVGGSSQEKKSEAAMGRLGDHRTGRIWQARIASEVETIVF